MTTHMCGIQICNMEYKYRYGNKELKNNKEKLLILKKIKPCLHGDIIGMK